MVWEPRNFIQRTMNFFLNMIEVYPMIIIGIVAYTHPSVNAIWYILLSLSLFHSMTKDIKDRFKWNMMNVLIIFGFTIFDIIYKVYVKKKILVDGKKYALEDYKVGVDRLLKLGFSFEWERKAFEKNASEGPYEFDINSYSFMTSFNIEIITFLLSTILFVYSYFQHYKI